jgi:hypothetical protein
MKSDVAFPRMAPILGDFVAVVVITTATDVLMHAGGICPPWGERMEDGLFVLPLGYRILYAILGGYIAARRATYKPVSHASRLIPSDSC